MEFATSALERNKYWRGPRRLRELVIPRATRAGLIPEDLSKKAIPIVLRM